MSILASAPDSFCDRKSAVRDSIAAVMAVRTSLSSLPTTGFSSLESDFICSPQEETLPLRPRYFTRAASSACSSPADSISRRASSRSCSSGWAMKEVTMLHGYKEQHRCNCNFVTLLTFVTLVLRRFLLRLRLIFERALGLLSNRFESVCVVDSDIGKNFPVESDASGFQTFSETAVG